MEGVGIRILDSEVEATFGDDAASVCAGAASCSVMALLWMARAGW